MVWTVATWGDIFTGQNIVLGVYLSGGIHLLTLEKLHELLEIHRRMSAQRVFT